MNSGGSYKTDLQYYSICSAGLAEEDDPTPQEKPLHSQTTQLNPQDSCPTDQSSSCPRNPDTHPATLVLDRSLSSATPGADRPLSSANPAADRPTKPSKSKHHNTSTRPKLPARPATASTTAPPNTRPSAQNGGSFARTPQSVKQVEHPPTGLSKYFIRAIPSYIRVEHVKSKLQSLMQCIP